MSKQRTRPRGSRPAKRTAPAKDQAKDHGKDHAKDQAKRKQKAKTRGRGHVGWAGMRRTRRQRYGIAAAALAAIALIWIFTDWRLAIGLTAIVLIALPAAVVLTMGRRY